MLVTSDHYHFNTAECGELSIHKEVCGQAREFFCKKHSCTVGPSGYEWGHIPPTSPDEEYNIQGCWLFLCSLIRSMTDKIEISAKLPSETVTKYEIRVKKTKTNIQDMRIALAKSYYKPIVMYSDISGVDYGKILKSIIVCKP